MTKSIILPEKNGSLVSNKLKHAKIFLYIISRKRGEGSLAAHRMRNVLAIAGVN